MPREKRGVFVLGAEFPDGGHIYISSPPGQRGHHLLMFNELLLANLYVQRFREELKSEKISADFPTDFIFIQEISSQEQWDELQKYLLSDNIENALINPCLEERTMEHNCIIRPIGFAKHPDLNELSTLFASLPDTHVNIEDGSGKVIKVVMADNY